MQLLHPEVQDYLNKHEATPLPDFLFKGSPFEQITVQELAQQLEGKRKAKNKLPLWYRTKNIIYPPKLNLEQTSSEVTASYKASLFTGKTVVDGTGGFGIDAYYFAQKIEEVIHIELNSSLSSIARKNASTLALTNIKFIVSDSIDYFNKTNFEFDTIYLDPGRRTASKGKVFMLKDCLPNVPLYKNLLLSVCKVLWVKTAPLLDITAGIQELGNVSEIHIVAVKNEVKELLWKITKTSSTNPTLRIVNLDSDDPNLKIPASELRLSSPTYGEPMKYLYEPNAALMKSGAFNWVCNKFDVQKLAEHSHLYTSESLKDFAGRRFKIERVTSYSKKIAKDLGLKKANITTRNFPLKVTEIRNKLKINEGGNIYLFFTTLHSGKLVVIICHKL
ncbi:class I SAM-dependent methyltransferase [Dokdonia sp. Hel_I_53]|uniref:class I SAM-dependent methyltransferase n=1 Tax=Dokdonia sp. Hel_I_53 TaxID=1566287 RepID=UPI00119C52F8|nr:class I SAM-dependent methyltransferase [Dokdonia sp. Hel_I_53]TVZ51312.1 putative methyltransferase [Dokdonia sp. Hel_I_53]